MPEKIISLCLTTIKVGIVFGVFILYVYFALQISLYFTERFSPRLTWDIRDKFIHKEGIRNGQFAVHEWNNLCKGSIQHLFKSPAFPNHPDVVRFQNKLLMSSRHQNSGRRLSGYLNVPETGIYMFLLNSSGVSELWLSESQHHKDLELAAKVQSENPESKTNQKFQYSTEVFLSKDTSHPVEIFHFGDFLGVFWIQPGKHEFEVVGGRHISHGTKSIGHEGLAHWLFKNKENEMDESKALKFSLISFISPAWVRKKAMQVCSFGLKGEVLGTRVSSTAALKTNIEVLFSDPDGRELERWKERQEVRHLVEFYMKGLGKAYPKRFKVKRVYRVEKLSLSTNPGPLYLLEIELQVDGLDYPERAVEYIHNSNASHFCYPEGLNWKSDAFINLVVVVNNQTKSLKLFIASLEKAFEEALEVDLHLIVVDFQETRVKIESILNQTTLKDRFTVTKMDGPYSKSRGFNKGASLVKGKYPIILGCDVHVDIPDTLFEDTKKHCVEGRMAFVPVVFQSDCRSHSRIRNPSGSWRFHSYDVIGIYKEDWTRMYGMDETLFEENEDWDLVHRIRTSGLFITRYQYPGLYRYDHASTTKLIAQP